jgi:hypothetical protein
LSSCWLNKGEKARMCRYLCRGKPQSRLGFQTTLPRSTTLAPPLSRSVAPARGDVADELVPHVIDWNQHACVGGWPAIGTHPSISGREGDGADQWGPPTRDRTGWTRRGCEGGLGRVEFSGGPKRWIGPRRKFFLFPFFLFRFSFISILESQI